jgi:glycosyltransferase involved in cell wall biosynthesis
VLGLNVHGYDRHLRQIAVRLGIADAVHFPGYVPHAKLRHWYRQARALLLLSACEAFPLPPLEAMACGTPVIASNLSSVPEVVGTGGVVIDPYNTTQLACVMRRMIEDERFREEQTAAGRRWVGQYSWEQTAGRIAQLLHACSDRLAASP